MVTLSPESTRVQQLKKVAIFADLDTGVLQHLAEHLRERTFPAHHILFTEGEPGYTLYIIVKGLVHIQSITEKGRIVHIAARKEGECIGELALIDGEPRMADAVCMVETKILMLNRDDFMTCIQKSPCASLGLLAILAKRLREAAVKVEDDREADILKKVARILFDLMQTQSEDDPSGGKKLKVKLTQQEIADQIGVRRESINRALGQLRDAGVILMDGRSIIIKKPEKLRSEC